jgi:hypothetical protein
MAIMGKKPIPGLGDDLPIDDDDLGLPSAPMGGMSLPGAVTPSFGSQSLSKNTASASPSFSTPAPAPVADRTAGAAVTAAGGAESTVAHSKESADWINTKWRPAMGWLYMATCFFDFVVFPILWSILQTLQGGQVTSQWQPLTLQGAGLYHIAMGAVLGIAAYGRTKEKLGDKQ